MKTFNYVASFFLSRGAKLFPTILTSKKKKQLLKITSILIRGWGMGMGVRVGVEIIPITSYNTNLNFHFLLLHAPTKGGGATFILINF